jgi:hypothetical protein
VFFGQLVTLSDRWPSNKGRTPPTEGQSLDGGRMSPGPKVNH